MPLTVEALLALIPAHQHRDPVMLSADPARCPLHLRRVDYQQGQVILIGYCPKSEQAQRNPPLDGRSLVEILAGMPSAAQVVLRLDEKVLGWMRQGRLKAAVHLRTGRPPLLIQSADTAPIPTRRTYRST